MDTAILRDIWNTVVSHTEGSPGLRGVQKANLRDDKKKHHACCQGWYVLLFFILIAIEPLAGVIKQEMFGADGEEDLSCPGFGGCDKILWFEPGSNCCVIDSWQFGILASVIVVLGMGFFCCMGTMCWVYFFGEMCCYPADLLGL